MSEKIKRPNMGVPSKANVKATKRENKHFIREYKTWKRKDNFFGCFRREKERHAINDDPEFVAQIEAIISKKALTKLKISGIMTVEKSYPDAAKPINYRLIKGMK